VVGLLVMWTAKEGYVLLEVQICDSGEGGLS
jgi:hypothetical protein